MMLVVFCGVIARCLVGSTTRLCGMPQHLIVIPDGRLYEVSSNSGVNEQEQWTKVHELNLLYPLRLPYSA
ncbi:hypothetical protein CPC08DRAFT_96477 [Agrocybe pediades]|nr:hypothetical protein CPC08DRAFT_96477 [Agrocybe pediades]